VTLERVEVELAAVLAEVDTGRQHVWDLFHAGDWEGAKASIAQWRARRQQGRRYSLVLPSDLFEEVEQLAARQRTSVVELLRRFTRLGLVATQIQDRPGAALLIRENGAEREIMLL
jgi:hypothetical protein